MGNLTRKQSNHSPSEVASKKLARVSRGLWESPKQSAGDKGVEEELLPLLSTIVKAEESTLICETGAFPGNATRAILSGMNKRTQLHSWESNPDFISFISPRLVIRHKVLEGSPSTFQPYDCTILDSSPYGLRDDEYRLWWASATIGSLLIVHDVLDTRWRKPWIGNPPIVFGTKWGIGIWRKTF